MAYRATAQDPSRGTRDKRHVVCLYVILDEESENSESLSASPAASFRSLSLDTDLRVSEVTPLQYRHGLRVDDTLHKIDGEYSRLSRRKLFCLDLRFSNPHTAHQVNRWEVKKACVCELQIWATKRIKKIWRHSSFTDVRYSSYLFDSSSLCPCMIFLALLAEPLTHAHIQPIPLRLYDARRGASELYRVSNLDRSGAHPSLGLAWQSICLT